MKITNIRIHEVALPSKGIGGDGPAGAESAGTTFSKQDSNVSVIVEVETDAGITGVGEVCVIGTHYMRGFSQAAAAGVRLLAPSLIGEDPFQTDRLNRQWDRAFKEDFYVKAPIDMALWDIKGKATGRPVCDLLGGRYPGQPPLYRSIYNPPEVTFSPDQVVAGCRAARAEGFRHFQLKPGKNKIRSIDDEIVQIEAAAGFKDRDEAVLVDANGNWTLTEAIRAARALKGLDIILEQPCATWEECQAFRPYWQGPVKLDELIETPQDLMRGAQAGAMDSVAIKISRVGGLTKAKHMRDIALDLGITVVPDDSWGSEIASSAILHFAASTDPRYLLCHTDLTDYVSVSTATGYPERHGGSLTASDEAGLGVVLRDLRSS